MTFLERVLPDSVLLNPRTEKKYIKAGANFGFAVSLLYMGECTGFKQRLEEWSRLEKEYVRQGFRTVSLDEFVRLGGYGKPIDELIGEKLEQDEEPIFHAEIYEEHFLGKVAPVVDINTMMADGKSQIGQYVLPSTERIRST